MKIKELQISNVLSFKYVDDISNATKIVFNDNLNIFIGENGAGKSTALEVINFLFKRVLFTQFNINQDLYSKQSTLVAKNRKQILLPANNESYSGFRLEPNWDTEDQPQKIRLIIELDDIDKKNIENLTKNKEKLKIVSSLYSNHSVDPNTTSHTKYTIDITLNHSEKTFAVNISSGKNDPGYLYLVNYNFYKELINFYNLENNKDSIDPLFESFTLIGGYRNYHSFNPSVSLKDGYASKQIQNIRTQEFTKSLNTNENAEPTIFNLVRLRVAEKHYELGELALTNDQKEKQANNLPFLLSINERLKLVNLECKIRLSDRISRQYAFEFFDTKRQKTLTDINSLSAGQKAIIHLVFEAYGRGELKGGLVIIDEPEIHLHYQFQNEYLSVIEEINKTQKCQYVLVTHSESLINSETIHKVKRFALDKDLHSVIKTPKILAKQKDLIKILDNTRSTYAFFAKKIILVEGETDRYFIKSVLQEINPALNQQIAVLDIIGKPNYDLWKDFFENFGLTVSFIGDLDSAFGFLYPTETPYKLHTPAIINGFKCTHPNLEKEIESKYSERIFILKNGDLEHYLSIHNKGLPETIKFCNDNLSNYLKDNNNDESKEIQLILKKIIE